MLGCALVLSIATFLYREGSVARIKQSDDHHPMVFDDCHKHILGICIPSYKVYALGRLACIDRRIQKVSNRLLLCLILVFLDALPNFPNKHLPF